MKKSWMVSAGSGYDLIARELLKTNDNINIELEQLNDKNQYYLDKYIAHVSKDKDELSKDELYFLEKDIEKETMYIECFLEWLQKKGVQLVEEDKQWK